MASSTGVPLHRWYTSERGLRRLARLAALVRAWFVTAGPSVTGRRRSSRRPRESRPSWALRLDAGEPSPSQARSHRPLPLSVVRCPRQSPVALKLGKPGLPGHCGTSRRAPVSPGPKPANCLLVRCPLSQPWQSPVASAAFLGTAEPADGPSPSWPEASDCLLVPCPLSLQCRAVVTCGAVAVARGLGNPGLRGRCDSTPASPVRLRPEASDCFSLVRCPCVRSFDGHVRRRFAFPCVLAGSPFEAAGPALRDYSSR